MRDEGNMKVGDLYRLSRYRWMLPAWSIIDWRHIKTVMYLGVDSLKDGHRVLADGREAIVETRFLSHFEPIAEGEKDD